MKQEKSPTPKVKKIKVIKAWAIVGIKNNLIDYADLFVDAQCPGQENCEALAIYEKKGVADNQKAFGVEDPTKFKVVPVEIKILNK